MATRTKMAMDTHTLVHYYYFPLFLFHWLDTCINLSRGMPRWLDPVYHTESRNLVLFHCILKWMELPRRGHHLVCKKASQTDLYWISLKLRTTSVDTISGQIAIKIKMQSNMKVMIKASLLSITPNQIFTQEISIRISYFHSMIWSQPCQGCSNFSSGKPGKKNSSVYWRAPWCSIYI